MIKAIIFDFFGVLSDRSLGRFVDDHFPDNQIKRAKSQELRRESDLGHLSRRQLVESLAELAGVPVERVLEYQSNLRINQELLNYIRTALKPKYKIGILSNAAADYAKELMSKEDLELFDDILVSYKFGLTKPDPALYQMAAKGLGVRPEECIFIDDNKVCCDGAKEAGMQAILYRGLEQLKADLEKLALAAPDN